MIAVAADAPPPEEALALLRDRYLDELPDLEETLEVATRTFQAARDRRLEARRSGDPQAIAEAATDERAAQGWVASARADLVACQRGVRTLLECAMRGSLSTDKETHDPVDSGCCGTNA